MAFYQVDKLLLGMNVELGVDAPHMGGHRVLGQEQRLANVRLRAAARQVLAHLGLAWRQLIPRRNTRDTGRDGVGGLGTAGRRCRAFARMFKGST